MAIVHQPWLSRDKLTAHFSLIKSSTRFLLRCSQTSISRFRSPVSSNVLPGYGTSTDYHTLHAITLLLHHYYITWLLRDITSHDYYNFIVTRYVFSGKVNKILTSRHSWISFQSPWGCKMRSILLTFLVHHIHLITQLTNYIVQISVQVYTP